MAGNELLMLIYDNVEKLSNAMKSIRTTVEEVNSRLDDVEKNFEIFEMKINERIGGFEVSVGDSMKNMEVELNKKADSIEDLVTNVTNPSIEIIGKGHVETRNALNEVREMHNQIKNNVELYDLQFVKLNNEVKRLRVQQNGEADVQEENTEKTQS